MQAIASLRPGNKAAVLGEIKSTRLAITSRRGFKIFHAVLGDASGDIRCKWMNQAYLADILKPHLQVVVFGDVKLDSSSGLHFLNPEFELVSEDLSGVHTGRIVPFYEKTGTVTPNMQRRLVRQALDELPADIVDVLPPDVRAERGLIARRPALLEAHFPPNELPVEQLNAFRTPGAAAPDLRGVLPLSDRPRVAAARHEHRAEAVRSQGGRPHPGVVREDPAVQAHARAATGAQGDRRRHAAAAADEPAAPGRRRRGQDNRCAAGCHRRDGERPAGGVHGADRDPRRTALQQHRAAAVRSRVFASTCSPAARRGCTSTRCRRTSSAARRTWLSARTPSSRRRSRSTSWVSW